MSIIHEIGIQNVTIESFGDLVLVRRFLCRQFHDGIHMILWMDRKNCYFYSARWYTNKMAC